MNEHTISPRTLAPGRIVVDLEDGSIALVRIPNSLTPEQALDLADALLDARAVAMLAMAVKA